MNCESCNTEFTPDSKDQILCYLCQTSQNLSTLLYRPSEALIGYTHTLRIIKPFKGLKDEIWGQQHGYSNSFNFDRKGLCLNKFARKSGLPRKYPLRLCQSCHKLKRFNHTTKLCDVCRNAPTEQARRRRVRNKLSAYHNRLHRSKAYKAGWRPAYNKHQRQRHLICIDCSAPFTIAWKRKHPNKRCHKCRDKHSKKYKYVLLPSTGHFVH